MPAFPPGRPSRRSKGDGGLHARRRVTRHRQRLTVSSQAAASSFAEWPKPPPSPPKGEGGLRRGNRWGSLLHPKLGQVMPAPRAVGGQEEDRSRPPPPTRGRQSRGQPARAPPRTSGGSRGDRVHARPPPGGGQAAACRGVFTFPTTRAAEPAPTRGRPAAGAQAPAAAACRGVFTFPATREVIPAPRPTGHRGYKRSTGHARLPLRGGGKAAANRRARPPGRRGVKRRPRTCPPPPPPGGAKRRPAGASSPSPQRDRFSLMEAAQRQRRYQTAGEPSRTKTALRRRHHPSPPRPAPAASSCPAAPCAGGPILPRRALRRRPQHFPAAPSASGLLRPKPLSWRASHT